MTTLASIVCSRNNYKSETIINNSLILEPRDLRDLEYPRALGCSVPSVARALQRARGEVPEGGYSNIEYPPAGI